MVTSHGAYYDVVEVDDDHDDKIRTTMPRLVKVAKGKITWVKVKTVGGIEGYLPVESIRSPIDYRAYFQKLHGRWKMTAFVSGD